MELRLTGDECESFWNALMASGVQPVVLGARDTLRPEAIMNLYGNDIDAGISPLETNMASTVRLDGREFIGAAALRVQLEDGELRQLIGVVSSGKGVLRDHYDVVDQGEVVGEITSGAFSPTFPVGVGLARVTLYSGYMAAEIRGKNHVVECVTPAFVRLGRLVHRKLT